MASDEAGHVAWQQLQRCYFVFVYYFYTIHLKTHISHTLPAVPPPRPHAAAVELTARSKNTRYR